MKIIQSSNRALAVFFGALSIAMLVLVIALQIPWRDAWQGLVAAAILAVLSLRAFTLRE